MRKNHILPPRSAMRLAVIGPLAAAALLTTTVVVEVAAADQADRKVDIAGVSWLADYDSAYRAAVKQQRMLLINFTLQEDCACQRDVDAAISSRSEIRAKLDKMVLCRVPVDATIQREGESKKLLASGAFSSLRNGPGFVLIDLTDRNSPHYGRPVTFLPFQSGKYYRFSTNGFVAALDLPPGTLTQRTMIWAVRIHPERPQSTSGQMDPHLTAGAVQHASYQASVQQQGHQNFERRFHTLSAAAGGSVAEVCAESWPGQTMIDSCIDCVASWRQSSGHWRAVSRPHRAFGYDIRRGRDGIWYATGLFAD